MLLLEGLHSWQQNQCILLSFIKWSFFQKIWSLLCLRVVCFCFVCLNQIQMCYNWCSFLPDPGTRCSDFVMFYCVILCETALRNAQQTPHWLRPPALLLSRCRLELLWLGKFKFVKHVTEFEVVFCHHLVFESVNIKITVLMIPSIFFSVRKIKK